ncbi:MAG: hypothetical protein ABSE84_11100 [Isosphaeraceae bacterium]|jgi:hypothetical protein
MRRCRGICTAAAEATLVFGLALSLTVSADTPQVTWITQVQIGCSTPETWGIGIEVSRTSAIGDEWIVFDDNTPDPTTVASGWVTADVLVWSQASYACLSGTYEADLYKFQTNGGNPVTLAGPRR